MTDKAEEVTSKLSIKKHCGRRETDRQKTNRSKVTKETTNSRTYEEDEWR